MAETAGEEPIHVEFQISDDDDHMRRVRYCNGSIDTHLLQKGKAYKELPDVYHIYITMNDFIGGGQTVYEIFRTVCDREGTYSTQYPVENGVHELYINLEIPLGDGSELDHLLRYIKETTEENEDACFGHIIKSVKECREGEDEIMKYYSSHEFLRNKLQNMQKSGKIETLKKPDDVKLIKLDKYQKATYAILNEMLNNYNAIKTYEKRLNYLPYETARYLANEIIYYSKHEKDFVLADFITQVSDKEELALYLKEVLKYDNEAVSMANFDDYLKVIEEYKKNQEIKRLKELMKKEVDQEKKALIADKIRLVKMGS